MGETDGICRITKLFYMTECVSMLYNKEQMF